MLNVHDIASACSCTQTNASRWVSYLNDVFDTFDISNAERHAAFLAQISVESMRLSVVVENLNYSSQGLLNIFPTHFSSAEAMQCARNPLKIANKVYANQYGNGNEASGDGWRYRGRGLIQITFKDNYKTIGDFLLKKTTGVPDFVVNPDQLMQEKWASMSAGAFWFQHGCNQLADAGDFDAITRKINGGLTDRLARSMQYIKAKQALGLT